MIVLKGFCYKNTNFQVHGNRSTRKLQNVSLGTFIILIDPADFEFESWKLHNQPDSTPYPPGPARSSLGPPVACMRCMKFSHEKKTPTRTKVHCIHTYVVHIL